MPEEKSSSEEGGKIGVYLCGCRGEISKNIDLENVRDIIAGLPQVGAVGIHDALCSAEGQDYLRGESEKHGFKRVVVAACSPNIQGIIIAKALEKVGLNKYLFEQINVREQCAWVHEDKGEATKKALSLINMGIHRVSSLSPLEDLEIPILPSTLVIGGGVAGMQAALDIAKAGFKAYLVERTKELGGRAYKLSMTFPTHNCGICCMQYCRECVFTPKIEDVLQEKNIDLMLNSEIENIEGGFGNRRVKVRTPNGPREFSAGTIVVATGSKTFDPKRIPELSYGHPDVLTTVEFEHMIVKQREKGGEVRRPSDSRIPKTINFIQCVGSRDKSRGNAYCSLVCCTYAIGQARELKKLLPESNIYIHYIDLRGPYRGFEEFYDAARQEGIQFVRGRVSDVTPDGDRLHVRAEDTDTGTLLDIDTDMVVLAVGQEPSDESAAIVKMLHIQTDLDRFMKDINPMFPPEFRRGIYVAGTAQGPRGIRYSIDDAKTSAAEIVRIMREGKVKMPRITAQSDEFKCRGCGRCVEVCEFGAITLVPDGKGGQRANVDEIVCEGCGACAAACCNKAMTLNSFSIPQLLEAVFGIAEEVGK